ncbi:MAG: hypothetical protein ACOCTS_02545 [Thermodesulfobacteriota bacterium]
MRGFPKRLKTAYDFEFLHERALADKMRPRHVEELKKAWQALLAGRWKYEKDRELEEDEEPDGDEPEYRVLEDKDEETGETRRIQYKRAENDAARIYKLGFGVDKVREKIDELDALEV